MQQYRHICPLATTTSTKSESETRWKITIYKFNQITPLQIHPNPSSNTMEYSVNIASVGEQSW